MWCYTFAIKCFYRLLNQKWNRTSESETKCIKKLQSFTSQSLTKKKNLIMTFSPKKIKSNFLHCCTPSKKSSAHSSTQLQQNSWTFKTRKPNFKQIRSNKFQRSIRHHRFAWFWWSQSRWGKTLNLSWEAVFWSLEFSLWLFDWEEDELRSDEGVYFWKFFRNLIVWQTIQISIPKIWS
jgi:hypothetical protein